MTGITGSPRGALRSPISSNASAIDVVASIGSRRMMPAGSHDTLRFSKSDAAARRAAPDSALPPSVVFLELFLLLLDGLLLVDDDDVAADDTEVAGSVGADFSCSASRFDFDFLAVGGEGSGSPTCAELGTCDVSARRRGDTIVGFSFASFWLVVVVVVDDEDESAAVVEEEAAGDGAAASASCEAFSVVVGLGAARFALLRARCAANFDSSCFT